MPVAIIIIIIIRQDNCGSSALIGFQRIEGTLVGSVLAFTVFQVLRCQDEEDISMCNPYYTTPILVVWNGLCGLYREDPMHGYAATVAGFTPNFLLLGPLLVSLDGAWTRVEMTFLGIALYLLIDNTLYPNRSDYSLRSSIVTSIDMIHSILEEFRTVIEVEIGFNNDEDIVAEVDETSGDEQKRKELEQRQEEEEEDKLRVLTEGFRKEVQLQKIHLDLAAFEPELWHPPYSKIEYESIHQLLVVLCDAAIKLHVALIALVETKRAQQRSPLISSTLYFEKTKYLYSLLADISTIAARGVKEALAVTSLHFDALSCSENLHAASDEHTCTNDNDDDDDDDGNGQVALEMNNLGADYRVIDKESIHTYNDGDSQIKGGKIRQLLFIAKSVSKVSEQMDKEFRSVYKEVLSKGEDDTILELVIRFQNIYELLLELVTSLNDLGRHLNVLHYGLH